MPTRSILKTTTACLFALTLAQAAQAQDFNIPGGDLARALNAYTAQTGQSLVISGEAVRGVQSKGARGNLKADDALSRILSGTGFTIQHESGVIAVVRGERQSSSMLSETSLQFAQATPPPRTSVETVTVTSSKLGGGDVQSIPIAITALSQEQLTATQTAGGPDLVKQVPNLTFTKTNFTGYSIQIRGIGTQAISVTTDPAVAVAFNDMPFIRNHFFEQEFFDVSQVEVLRGPQGTLYGRNATAGVVNLISAKPSDQFEAKLSADIGNYKNRRFEGMVNLPLVDDRLAIRVAGEWTKRNGYTTNGITGNDVDGRNLWSSRVTIGWKPLENVQANLVWEHFSENDNRMRTSKQLCKTDPGVRDVLGTAVPDPQLGGSGVAQAFKITTANVSQGCLPASLYADESFGVPNGFSLPIVVAGWVSGGMAVKNPYASTRQSTNLREIETSIDPHYRAKNDTAQLNVDVQVSPSLTVTSQTGYNQDFLWSTQDFNRFNTNAGMFLPSSGAATRAGTLVNSDGAFCDPQLGCSSRLIAQDISRENAWQLNQEIRLASKFSGPLNFSVGGNYMHYETSENYYVFINSLTAFSFAQGGGLTGVPVELQRPDWQAGISDNSQCLWRYGGYKYYPPEGGGGQPNVNACTYIDPNPISSLNDEGHNYFLSKNPYVLNSWAGFGEAYYTLTDDVKLTGGLRYTRDDKHFPMIPSWLLGRGLGYPVMDIVNQSWGEFTGRANINWTPDLNFTDQTLLYASYAHGYKAGGANPPGAVMIVFGSGDGNPVHPRTFAPEFIDAFEIGTKNSALDGTLTFNSTAFYYDYKGYQVSEIIDRTSINRNFDARVVGAEVEGVWEPAPGLRFNFAGGWEDTKLAKGSQSIDMMDRTGGNPDWIVVKPFATQASNCIIPRYVAENIIRQINPSINGSNLSGTNAVFACAHAYFEHLDPVTQQAYNVVTPTTHILPGYYTIPAGYTGFDPVSPTATNNGAGPAPNNGEGFFKDLSGNELPNAPKFTVSFGAQYSVPLTSDWAATLRSDFYWQDSSWARVFNDDPYDHIRGYSTVNLSLMLTSQSGWQAMGYIKNVFNKTAITGTFLNSDDSGLTTNVFLTDPRLIGVRVTKNW